MRRVGLCWMLAVLILSFTGRTTFSAPVASESAKKVAATKGTVEFVPTASEASLPKMYQLEPHKFSYDLQPVKTSGQVMQVSKLTFPSPVITPHENNNTVHCEYFRPTGKGKKPAVIVLHILGGDFDLARLFCRTLATKGVNALFLKMPYYGERQQPGIEARMISTDPDSTLAGMRQAILDIREATTWLSAQQEVDAKQLGIMGISLGGITGSLAISLEPRFSKGCFLLAGGDMGQVAWTSTEMEPFRKKWQAEGRSKEDLFAMLKPIDPVTYAKPLPGRKILMLNASHDEVVPPACTVALWKAFGEPEIVWWDAGHYTAVRYIFGGIVRVVDFFKDPNVQTPVIQTSAK